MEWFFGELRKATEWIINLIFEIAVVIIDLIPLPDWATNIDLTPPPSVSFWVEMFQLPQGLAIMMSALGIRFIIRLLPIIT